MTHVPCPWDEQFARLVIAALPAAARHDAAPLTVDHDLSQAGLESMATVELLIRLETAYGVRFPEHLLTGGTFATPGDLWEALQSLREDAKDTEGPTDARR
ncbi:hypothetical protein DMA15_22810 [Streptomyces sp. WAC 01529]|uniref:phosphopantetheine-binding protein n=1 Tax=Streptomyces sp. WAC 01529 TaxID=2203205 RepID=UPI000F71E9AF|nr:phosphopantetheine-binding protein [Streptomyces sp. WAC 01529]AZM55048.1 hypothetical protein DMA15_22810 [Streptomyces sp. WAC 01529]